MRCGRTSWSGILAAIVLARDTLGRMFGSGMMAAAGTLATMSAWLAGFGVFVLAWLGGVWLLCAVLVAAAAHQRGRTAFGWLLLALVLTPLAAGLLLALFPPQLDARIRADARRGRRGWQLCPSCNEAIRRDARRCRYCLLDLTRRVATLPLGAVPGSPGLPGLPGSPGSPGASDGVPLFSAIRRAESTGPGPGGAPLSAGAGGPRKAAALSHERIEPRL